MAGAYCMYCDRRCFVYREVIVGGEFLWGGHMATCEHGKQNDREAIGQDADTAHNPLAEQRDREAS
jgi:hypothetical protein